MVDVWDDLGGGGRGRAIGIYVLVDMTDWELDHIKASFLRLKGRAMKREEKDRVIWMNSRNEASSIKSLYSIMELGYVIPFLVTMIWNSWVTPKAGVFVWGKVLIRD